MTLNVRFGSLAACQHSTTAMSAIGQNLPLGMAPKEQLLVIWKSTVFYAHHHRQNFQFVGQEKSREA